MPTYYKEPYSKDRLVRDTMVELNENISILGGMVSQKNAGYEILIGDTKQIFSCDSSDDRLFQLPIVEDSDIGMEVTIIKMGSGKVTIQPQVTEYIEDGAIGLPMYSDSADFAVVTLVLLYGEIGTTKVWKIKSAVGEWVTTE